MLKQFFNCTTAFPEYVTNSSSIIYPGIDASVVMLNPHPQSPGREVSTTNSKENKRGNIDVWKYDPFPDAGS